MKKLIIILFCLPLIGFGQITVNEVQKKQNNIEFTKNLSYSIKSGLGIEIFPEMYVSRHTLFSYYLIPNVNYNISINNKLGIYNTISLPIILRNRKKGGYSDDFNPADPVMQGEDIYYPTTLIAKIEYNVGVEAEINEDLQGRLGIIIPIYRPYIKKYFLNDTDMYGFNYQWGAGFNNEWDYSLTDNLCSSLSISRELMWNNLFSNLSFNQWVTEILIGVNYKL